MRNSIVLMKLAPTFVGYHKSRHEEYVAYIRISNNSNFKVLFSLSLLRRGERKHKGLDLFKEFQIASGSTVHYYPNANGDILQLLPGDQLKFKSSKKGALTIIATGASSL